MSYELVHRNKHIDDFISSIVELKKKYDVVPEKSTTTDGSWGGFSEIYQSRNDNPEGAEVLSIVEELLEMIDLRHIGNGILYTSAYPSEGMIEFCAVAEPLIQKYINENLWDDVCNSEWSEEA